MGDDHATVDLLTRVSELAANASERLVPRPFRPMLDRTLVDVACASGGGLVPVAGRLRVDAPALDAWRSMGVPPEFRARLAEIAMRPGWGRAA